MHLTLCPNPSVDKFLELPGLTPGEVNRSTGEWHFPGGKGVHTALALKELEENTHLLGFWGGPTGRWIRDECQKRDVSTEGVEIEGWNRTCITIRPGSDGKKTEILEKGPEIDGDRLSNFFDLIEENLADSKSIIISGSWPGRTPVNVYKTIKGLSSELEIPIWVDASGEWLKQAIKINPYGIHINRKEAEFLFGAGKNPEIYADELLQYCTVSAVTDGANGLFLAKDRRMVHAVCPVAQVISSVGSGDCLLAGLVTGFSKSSNLEDTARLGVACGAANCIRPDLGMLYIKDVQNLLNSAVVTELTNHE